MVPLIYHFEKESFYSFKVLLTICRLDFLFSSSLAVCSKIIRNETLNILYVTTLPRKNQKHESTLLHFYVLNEFLKADRSCTAKYFWKTVIENGSSHLYASFGTFFVQIGRLFESQWAFEECLNIDKSLFSKEMLSISEFF